MVLSHHDVPFTSFHPATARWTYTVPTGPVRAAALRPAPRRRTLGLGAAVALCAVAALLSAEKASAVPLTLINEQISGEVYVQSLITGIATTDSDRQIVFDETDTLPRSPVDIDLLLRADRALAYPDPPPGNTQNFVSAQNSSDGTYGAGASSREFAVPRARIAEVVVERTFRGDAAGSVSSIEFSVPEMRAGVAGFALQDGLVARTGFSLLYSIFSERGLTLDSGQVFDIGLTVTKNIGFAPPSPAPGVLPPPPVFAPATVFPTRDLRLLVDDNRANLNVVANPFGGAGLLQEAVVDPFRLQFDVTGLLNPGEVLFLQAIGEVTTIVDGIGLEGGAQALFGDPISGSGPSGPVLNYRLADLIGRTPPPDPAPGPDPNPAVIPLPAGFWLLATAIAGLGLRRRRPPVARA